MIRNSATTSPEATARGDGHELARPSILIVDDHEDNVELLRLMLAPQGYRIGMAYDGVAALESVRRDPPDLVLLDVMMPGLSGYEVVQKLRGDSAAQYIPVMLITAKQELSDKVLGLEYGADDFLAKPVQSTELIAKVHALLRLKQVQDALVRERNKNELLYLVGQQLASTLDIDQLIGQTLNLMVSLVGAAYGSVIALDYKRRTWRRIMAPEDKAPLSSEQFGLIMQHGLAGLALRTRQAQLVDDVAADDRWLPLDIGEEVRSALAIPLVRDDEDYGVLTLTHPAPHRFHPDQLPTVLAVAAQVLTALHNASLYTQVKEAEASHEYFVHMLTHDLRGPLAGIVGCLHLLGLGARSDADQQFLEMAHKAAQAQEGLIDEMLDIYRAGSGMLDLVRAPVRPSELGSAVIDQLAGAVAERGLDLHIDLPDEPELDADGCKMVRVLSNLVSNAIQFTRTGGISVFSATRQDMLEIVVRDTGIGIAAEDVPHVFDRFFHARQPGARRGTGLGLAFCREVIEAHGGRIWAASGPGAGTELRFTIPVIGKGDEQMAHPDSG